MKMQMKNTKWLLITNSTGWLSKFFEMLFFLAKKIFFFKWTLRSKISNFSKKNGIYIYFQLEVSNQCIKYQVDISIFYPQMGCFVSKIVPIYDVIFFKCDIWNF